VCHEYDKFDEERKHLSPTLFSLGVPVRNCIPGFAMLKNPCHLDPWLHYSGFLDSTMHLERKYQLSLPERLSLLRAMAVTRNSAYLYVAAASSLLQVTHLNDIHKKNYRFGLLLANMMVEMRREVCLLDVSVAMQNIVSQKKKNGTNNVTGSYSCTSPNQTRG
jgi:hypothetical protein